MKNHLGLLVFISSALTLAACSGGGRSSSGGRQCPENYPISMTPSPDQKVVQLESAKDDLPDGIYDYLRTDLFYVHKNGFRVQMKDVALTNGEISSSVECVRNANLGFTGINVASFGVSRMDVDSGKPILIDTRQFSFNTMSEKMVVDFVKLDSSKSEAPSDLYKTAFEQTHAAFIIEHPSDLFELRTYGDTPEGELYYSVQFRRRNR